MVAWIFHLTNVAHAYFWHIWLPEGNATLIMQGDHLFSAASVLVQAGLACAHIPTNKHWHTHTLADRLTHSLTAGGVHRQWDTHVYQQQTPLGGRVARRRLNFPTNWTKPPSPTSFISTNSACLSKAAVNLSMLGDREMHTLFFLCWAVNTCACLLEAAGAG